MEDVNYDAGQVNYNPVALLVTLNAQNAALEVHQELVGDGLVLLLVVAGTDNEIIGDAQRCLRHIESRDISGLFRSGQPGALDNKIA